MNLKAPFALFLTFSFIAFASAQPDDQAFLSCLINREPTISSIIFTPNNSSSFLTALNSLIQNARFINPQTPKPIAVLRPVKESQIQAAIYCGKKYDLQMRVRSGGHDFEGASYVSLLPFFVLDMVNFQSITVDSKTRTAWIGSGLTLGQVYYAISANSSLAFPAGHWPTVGVGGHISGGGYGSLVREHGLAADNVVDARVIDVNGRILDRKSMGEDFFWAIRGGVGSNFGVIVSYKVRLAQVPKVVSGFHINRTLEQNAIQLVYKWQQIARKLPVQFSLTLQLTSIVAQDTGKRTGQVEFVSVYRGDVGEMFSIVEQNFPELGLRKEDCLEMLWIQTYPFLIGFPVLDVTAVKEILTNRASFGQAPGFKWKVDLAEKPIPPEGIAKMFKMLLKVPPQSAQLGWTVFGGGAMDRISESDIPFPHRGKLMIMRQIIFWGANDTSEVVQTRVDWVRQLHRITGAYVPNNPRAAYADYTDLDLGVNNVVGDTSIGQARIWGRPYFKNNFQRLVKVKTLVDPQNYFKGEQSIPLLQRS